MEERSQAARVIEVLQHSCGVYEVYCSECGSVSADQFIYPAHEATSLRVKHTRMHEKSDLRRALRGATR